MDTDPKDTPKVIMLPPTLVLLHVCAALVLNWAIEIEIGDGWGWIGLILLGGGLWLIRWAKNTFDEAGTNVPPNQPALVIVKNGPYKFTRNPMYLGMLVALVGLAFLSGGFMMLCLTGSLFYFLDQRVIIPEEEYLSEKFGEEYGAYVVGTHRWLDLMALADVFDKDKNKE
jgi:protein-S-isoprenylcysteine O-methyltransferase Ste14